MSVMNFDPTNFPRIQKRPNNDPNKICEHTVYWLWRNIHQRSLPTVEMDSHTDNICDVPSMRTHRRDMQIAPSRLKQSYR